MTKEGYDTKTTLIISLLIIIGTIILTKMGFLSPLPEDCYVTPSVDIGGEEVVCE